MEIEMRPFEKIIKLCPFCLRDTEQQAYYVQNPSLDLTTHRPTVPPILVKVSAEEDHLFGWYVFSTCSTCGYTYRVMGVPKLRQGAIPYAGVKSFIKYALTGCDLCYYASMDCRLGRVFINLSNGMKVYLCDRHSRGVEEEKKITGSYSSLINKLGRWQKLGDTFGESITLDSGNEIAIRNASGSAEEVLLKLSSGSMGKERLIGEAAGTKDRLAIEEDISYMLSAGILVSSSSGLLAKKEHLTLTDRGKALAGFLRSRY